MIRTQLRLVSALFAAFVVLFASGVAAQAQDDDNVDTVELEELKQEQRRAQREAALAASQIDVFDANVTEVTEALDELADFVESQRGRLEDAEQAHRQATSAVESAQQRTREIGDEQEALSAHMAELAVASFTGEQSSSLDDLTELAFSEDPGESARFIHLLETQTGSLTDSLDRIRALEVEAELVIEAMRRAEVDAATALADVQERAAELDEALALQEQVVAAAEIRLEAQLAEAAVLQERDESLATEIADQQYAINERVAEIALRNGFDIPDPVRLEDIVRIEYYEDGVLPEPEVDPETGLVEPGLIPLEAEPFFALEVHVDIEAQVRALFDEAFEDGIELAGWGYRPIQRQIELRAAHCGGTEFDIWQKPAFECAPPTARPGFSRHEQGRAIDFTFAGSSITSRASAGFQWLAAHAPKYGFVNLESEPWHWSISEGDERLPG